MTYKCIPCQYSTAYSSHYAAHLKSNMHNDTINAKYSCNNCDKTYSTRQALSRHKINDHTIEKENTKLKTQLIEMKYDIKLKEHELNFKNKELKMEKKLNKTLKENADDFKSLAKTTAKTAAKSVSALTYVAQNYANAPPLKSINNYNILLVGNEKYTVPEVFEHYYARKELAQYVAKRIVKEYKKKKPEEQSIWNTDASRDNYIFKKFEGPDNPNGGWVRDKKGAVAASIMVNPLLENSKDELIKTAEQLNKELAAGNKDNSIFNKLSNFGDIIKMIGNESLSSEIMKHMSPELQLAIK